MFEWSVEQYSKFKKERTPQGIAMNIVNKNVTIQIYQGNGIGTDLMDKMIEYLKEKHIYMISVVYEERLQTFYKRFGFYNMLCGQMKTY